ncbi:glycosyltransferase [Lentibacillus sediminis]|uniref:glycosyltransferase n=1 Tax=Lentibacillus sediminis TaxID=1940529 RepID=UPI000C1B89E4|nr:glycosyltransferase [Lentibacillus sediminis]
MKDMLIASFDMEVGGVERSLISMLDHFDYTNYKVDLMLYKHQGEFMQLLTDRATLLREIPAYATFRKSIKQVFMDKQIPLGLSRIVSRIHADVRGKLKGTSEPGYYQMQLMWEYALPFLPELEKKYDVAVSYLWPHYFVAEKVEAKTKIAWIHTDYATVDTDVELDMKMWEKFDHIIAVSEACAASFLQKYPELEQRVTVIENITSPHLIRKLADERVESPMMDDQRFKLITVARLSHAKGIDQAVKALRQLKDRDYNFAWYVVGYGGDETMLHQLIAENELEDNFFLLGKKINPYPFIKAADLYVQPSRYEGKAVTVGEAQILGKPVLITNYTTAPSQVQDGFDGCICELSVEGIADGVEMLYNDPDQRQQLAANCIETDYENTGELKKLYAFV